MNFDIKALENVLKRRFFIAPSFEIHGSTSGLFDFGPFGCALKNEIEALWRRHFVLEEDLMEISGPNLTPYSVLKASGHVDRFLDFMVEDVVTKECLRADKWIIESLETRLDDNNKCTTSAIERKDITDCLDVIEGADAASLDLIIKKFQIRSPKNNELSYPYPFNLMFATRIGPKQSTTEDENQQSVVYLRPETAQGIFVNFKRLYEQNSCRMPFGAACMGTSFRNEIAPRNGLLRVREFPMAEIEYFVDPETKAIFPKYDNIRHVSAPFYARKHQYEHLEAEIITIDEAITKGYIANQSIAYFIGRTYLFLIKIGIDPAGIRFRQHLSHEMAHYASDCWDCELLTSYKWIECVGIADRSAFDLTQHSKATKIDLLASRTLEEPKIVKKYVAKPVRKLIGPKFGPKSPDILQAIADLSPEDCAFLAESLEEKGYISLNGDQQQVYELDSSLIEFNFVEHKVVEETFVPNVIEPSFGIGRIVHAVLEHAFRTRKDLSEERNWFKFSPAVAPIKCSILPLSNSKELLKYIDEIRASLVSRNLSCKIDSSTASIGKRYSRTDEIGIPFAITIDFETATLKSVTVREIESMKQVRIPIVEVADVLHSVIKGSNVWTELSKQYPSNADPNNSD